MAHSTPPDMEAFITAHGSKYPDMFAAAFGDTIKTSAAAPDTEINTARIAFAIATHERRLTSDQTPWDRWNAGDDDAMTEEQIRGSSVAADLVCLRHFPAPFLKLSLL